MSERQHKPTIAEAGWLQFTIQDHLEPLIAAAKQQLSDLDHMRTCESCLRFFDSADPRGNVNDEAREAFCPGCNIEATPALARAALAKALEMNPQLDQPTPDAARLDLGTIQAAEPCVVVAGSRRLYWFDGARFSLYRARAKTYPSRTAAIEAVGQIRKNFKRPNIRAVAFSERV